jgi:hypothetical protein
MPEGGTGAKTEFIVSKARQEGNFKKQDYCKMWTMTMSEQLYNKL